MTELGASTLGWDAFGIASATVASSTNVALTGTTTIAAIRAALVEAIDELQPRTEQSVRFRHTDSPAAEFRDYAETNETTALREYSLRYAGWEPVSSYDRQIQRRSATFELVVAYPHHWGSYREKQTGRLLHATALADTAEDDLSVILANVGIAGANVYPSGSVCVSEEYSAPETADGVTFAVASLAIEFFYDTRV